MPVSPKDALALLNASAGPENLLTAYQRLLPTQRQFVDHYVSCDNPTEAYFRTKPHLRDDPNGRSAVYARTFELMRNPLVQAAILERMKEIAGRIEVTQDMVKNEIAKIAFANLKNYIGGITAEGEPYYDFSDVTEAQWAAIGELTVETYTEGRGDDARDVKRVKFKTHPKLDALEKLAKILGMYAPDRVEHTGTVQHNHDVRAVVIHADATAEDAAAAYQRQLEGN